MPNGQERVQPRELLETMERIRRFEERVGEVFADNESPGFVHLYIGMEAVAAGTAAPLRNEDYITSTHRGHGHCIAKGLEFKPMMAELYGRIGGYCNGKGGSMHIADVTQGMFGANGVTASSTPVGGGAALAAQIRGNDRVAVSYLGEGATAQGPYHEALHLAATWDLPQIYVVENNHYGEMSSAEVQHPTTDMVRQADAYEIPGVIVNGQDVEEVRDGTVEAIDRARAGEGPTVIEAKTYRIRGHYEGDPQDYRADEDLPEWRTADPVTTYRDELLERGTLEKAEYEAMTETINEEIEAAVEFARNSPWPEPEEAYEGVYAEDI